MSSFGVGKGGNGMGVIFRIQMDWTHHFWWENGRRIARVGEKISNLFLCLFLPFLAFFSILSLCSSFFPFSVFLLHFFPLLHFPCSFLHFPYHSPFFSYIVSFPSFPFSPDFSFFPLLAFFLLSPIPYFFLFSLSSPFPPSFSISHHFPSFPSFSFFSPFLPFYPDFPSPTSPLPFFSLFYCFPPFLFFPLFPLFPLFSFFLLYFLLFGSVFQESLLGYFWVSKMIFWDLWGTSVRGLGGWNMTG